MTYMWWVFIEWYDFELVLEHPVLPPICTHEILSPHWVPHILILLLLNCVQVIGSRFWSVHLVVHLEGFWLQVGYGVAFCICWKDPWWFAKIFILYICISTKVSRIEFPNSMWLSKLHLWIVNIFENFLFSNYVYNKV